MAGLIQIAELYSEFDKKKSLDLFEQAFAAAASLPVTPVDKLGYTLPTEDPRRPQPFSAATTAYSARFTGPFTELVSRHW